MTIQFYPNGIGGSLGDTLDTARPLIGTCNIWFVNFNGGVDAAAPAGRDREKPLATLAQAVTNAADGDFIVFLAGHVQSLATAQAVAKSLTFIGEGTNSGKPAVSFTQGASVSLFTCTVANIQFRNIYFPPATVACNQPKVLLSGAAARGVFRGCYFEHGALDNGGGISLGLGSSATRIEGCTVISTATSVAAQPLSWLKLNATTIADLEIMNTSVSSGTVGWSGPAVDLTGATNLTGLRVEGMSLLLGADMTAVAGFTGYVNIQVATGGSRFQCT